MATSSGKRGRPQKGDGDKVSKMIVFKLNKNEHEKFEEYFKKSGFKTKKEFLLKSVENARVANDIVTDRISLLKDLAKYKSDFGHIGSNINQVAHIVNSIGYASTEAEIASRLAEMTGYLDMVEKKTNQILSLMGKFVNK